MSFGYNRAKREYEDAIAPRSGMTVGMRKVRMDASHLGVFLREHDAALTRIAELEAKIERDGYEFRELHDAAKDLILRMKAVHADERYKGVWHLAQVHGSPYSGPTYEHQMKHLAELVGLVQDTAE